jgi:hypothetical protein
LLVLVSKTEAQKAYRFHRSFPQYEETPLVPLDLFAARLVSGMAGKDLNGVAMQDTAWSGYGEIPAWIMQGYGT